MIILLRKWKTRMINNVEDISKPTVNNIISNLKKSGINKNKCNKIKKLALSSEGVYNLLLLWNDSNEKSYKREIMSDINELLKDTL